MHEWMYVIELLTGRRFHAQEEEEEEEKYGKPLLKPEPYIDQQPF